MKTKFQVSNYQTFWCSLWNKEKKKKKRRRNDKNSSFIGFLRGDSWISKAKTRGIVLNKLEVL